MYYINQGISLAQRGAPAFRDAAKVAARGIWALGITGVARVGVKQAVAVLGAGICGGGAVAACAFAAGIAAHKVDSYMRGANDDGYYAIIKSGAVSAMTTAVAPLDIKTCYGIIGGASIIGLALYTSEHPPQESAEKAVIGALAGTVLQTLRSQCS